MIECLTSNLETLGLIPSITEKGGCGGGEGEKDENYFLLFIKIETETNPY